jgi:hypothetical protein
MTDRVVLLPVDALDVTILVDNFVEILLPSTDVARRPPLVWEWSDVATFPRPGLSLDTYRLEVDKE